MAVFRKTHVRWILNGERVPAKTPGAKKVRERSRLWYGRYLDRNGRERTVALADRKGEAESELVRRRDDAEKRRRDPTHAESPTADHLADWRERLEAEGNTADQVPRHVFRAETVPSSIGVDRITGISDDAVIRAVARLKRAKGWPDGTATHYLAAAKGFSRWLWRSGRGASRSRRHASRSSRPRAFPVAAKAAVLSNTHQTVAALRASVLSRSARASREASS